jgi:peptide/nickel transport system ATP-binding protein
MSDRAIVPALEVDDLVVEYRRGRSRTRAVDSVTFTIARGETVGVVGESGSGKTSVARAVLGLIPVRDGIVRLHGRTLTGRKARGRREKHELAAQLQVVFQDPYSSLDPAQTVGAILSEALDGAGLSRAQVRERVAETLDAVGLDEHAAKSYPHQFSGGQRQRIAIARAIVRRPSVVVCDEPLSALDLSIQAQVVNLLLSLQEQFQISYLFIAHDLSIVRHLCQRVVVMYRGRLVESGTAEGVYTEPGHPYTQALLAAAPVPDPAVQRMAREARQASAASTAGARFGEKSAGCPFAPRCPFALEVCFEQMPQQRPRPDGGVVACHRYPEVLVSRANVQAPREAAPQHPLPEASRS